MKRNEIALHEINCYHRKKKWKLFKNVMEAVGDVVLEVLDSATSFGDDD